jgi:hypothetical protein
MKKVPLEKKILKVLEDEFNESGGSFLGINEIGKIIHKDSYQKQTAPIFNKQIRDRMYRVRELAEQNGMLVIPDRIPLVGKAKDKFRIIGWKIAGVEDERYIIDELLFKKRKGEEHTNAFQILKSTAIHNKLIGKEGLKELSVSL